MKFVTQEVPAVCCMSSHSLANLPQMGAIQEFATAARLPEAYRFVVDTWYGLAALPLRLHNADQPCSYTCCFASRLFFFCDTASQDGLGRAKMALTQSLRQRGCIGSGDEAEANELASASQPSTRQTSSKSSLESSFIYIYNIYICIIIHPCDPTALSSF